MNKYKQKLGDFVIINPESMGQDYPFTEIEYVDISSVGSGTLEEANRISVENAPSRAKRIVKNGDTILSTVRPNRRSFLFINQPPKNMIVSTGFAVLRPNNQLDPRYLYCLIRHQEFTDYLTNNAKGSAYPAVDLDTINKADLYIPSLPTQRKIASILSAYDDLIENNTRRIQILEDMAQTIYREWFVNFRFPGHEDVKLVESELGLIPEGWEVKKLGKVADLQWGDTNTTKKKYVEEGYPAFSASGFDGKLAYFDFDRDGVVLSAIGANCGRTWFIKNKWSCIKNTIRFWSIDKCASTEYLFYTTHGTKFWPKRGSAQPFISQTDARNIRIIIPTEKINNLFTDFVMKTMCLSDVLFQKNILLKKTRDLLLPHLISGELDVSEMEIER